LAGSRVMTKQNDVILFVTAALFLVLAFFSLPCSASEGLQVRAWTDKDQFLLHEPIPIHYEVTNTSDSTFSPDFDYTAQTLSITDDKEKAYSGHIFSSIYGSPFPPGDVHRSTLDVHALYDVTDPGEYTCFVPVWTCHGTVNSRLIKSNTIKFKVVEPSGAEKEALNLLLRAQELAAVDTNLGYPHPGKEELAVRQCQELVDKYPESVYAAMALLAAADIRARWREHRREAIAIYKKLVERYPEYHYWADGFNRLVEMYELLRDKESAIATMQELVEKHPNTKISEEAEKRLVEIKEWQSG
jgi:tetratricopeptide (TPR) repeat protein